MRIINYLAQLKTTFLNQSLPQSCFLCGAASSSPLCTDCLTDLPYQETTCQRCGKPLTISGICGKCQHHPPIYQQLNAVFTYDYPITKLIQAAKFNTNLAILGLLGKLMAQHLHFNSRPDILIPVPLHIHRLRYRGYNQSLELAKPISQKTGIPLEDNSCCIRWKNTPPQVSLSAKERRTNVKGAFRVIKEIPWEYIVIVDDVVTTGATVEELTTVLLQSGAKRVDIVCCARRAK